MRQELNLGNGYYLSESPVTASLVCQNLVPNYPQNNAISQSQVFGSPGIDLLVSTGDADINRGSIVLGGIPFFINGNFLYSLRRSEDINGNVVYITENEGAIIGDGRVSIAENGTQICIVVPGTGTGYIYTESGGLVVISDPDFTANGNAEVVVFIDGYFAFTTNSKKWFISALNDGTSYNALDFGTAEADPDNIRSAFVYRNQIYIFGSETIEVFNNVGGADFPFQRVQGFVIPKGIAGKFCVAAFDGSFAWLGQGENETPRVFVFTGNDGQAISNNAVEFNLEQKPLESIENSFVMTYSSRGRVYISFSFDDECFVYESKASKSAQKPVWHTRTSQIENQERWRVNSLVTAYGLLLAGDSVSGRIGILDDDNYTEYGMNIYRRLRFPPIDNQNKFLFYNFFQLVIEGGVNNDDTSSPQIGLSYSDDSHTFTQTRYRSMGKKGEYNRTVRWNRLGASDKYRSFEIETSAKVKVQWVKCFIEVESAT